MSRKREGNGSLNGNDEKGNYNTQLHYNYIRVQQKDPNVRPPPEVLLSGSDHSGDGCSLKKLNQQISGEMSNKTSELSADASVLSPIQVGLQRKETIFL